LVDSAEAGGLIQAKECSAQAPEHVGADVVFQRHLHINKPFKIVPFKTYAPVLKYTSFEFAEA
jgi:hypothetical protein